MNRTTCALSCLVCLFVVGIRVERSNGAVIVDFEDPPMAPNRSNPATSGDQSPLIHQGVQFSRDWNSQFDCCPSGWARSNETDQVTPGPLSAYSAYVAASGGGFNSGHFAVANNFRRGEARITFPGDAEVSGMYVTNVTYTYLAAINGEDGAGFVKGPFEAEDWLRLDVIGLDAQQQETGRVPIYLADFRAGNDQALDQWTWLDLSSLGSSVASLEFEMESTDIGPFGMNTPAYFAIDNLTYRVVPEPSGFAFALMAVGCWVTRRRAATSRESLAV